MRSCSGSCWFALFALPGLAIAAAPTSPMRMDAQGRIASAPARAIAAAADAPNGSTTWTALGPAGADVADVAVSPTAATVVLAGVAPAGSSGGTLYRSADGAASWTEVTAFSGTSVHRLAFGSDGAAYAASQSRVWKSSDDGQSWTRLAFGFSDPNDEAFAVAVAPSDPDIVWAGITDALGGQPVNLMRSLDGGTTWTDRTPPHDAPMTCDGIAIDPLDPDTVIAVFRGDFGGGEIWVSEDGGDSWTNRSAGLPANPLNAVVYDGSRLLVGGGQNFGEEDVGLYASSDLGATWTALHDAAWTSLVVTSIAVDPVDAQHILAATDGAGINASSDGGATWTLGVPGSSGVAEQSVVFAPADAGVAYSGASSLAVFKSGDNGATFANASAGISLISLYSVAANPLDPDEIAVAFQGQNNGGVYSSLDGGTTWTLETLPGTRYSKVGFAPDGTLYAISSGPTTIAPEGLYRRAADGSWSGLGPDQGPNFESNLDALQFSRNDPDLIYLGGADFGSIGFGSTVWRSADAGQTWTKVFLGDDNDMVTDIEIAADGSDADVVAVYDGFTDGQQGGAIRSDDGGLTWALALSGLPDYTRTPRLCRTVGATPLIVMSAETDASHGKLFVTDDAGADWSATGWSGPPIVDVACDPNDADTLYLAQTGSHRVTRSTDQGVSFVAFADGLAGSANPTDLAAVAENGGTRLFLATFAGSYATPAVAVEDAIFGDGFDGP